MFSNYLTNKFKTMYADKQKRAAEKQAAMQQKQQQRETAKQEAAVEKENLMRQQEEGERQRQADIAEYNKNKQAVMQQKQQAVQQKQQAKQQKQQAKQQEVEKDVMLYNSFPVFKMVGISEKDINPMQSSNFIGASYNLGNNIEKALKLLKDGYKGDANHEPIPPNEEEYKRLMMMAYENPRGPISKFIIYHDNNYRRNIAKAQAKNQKEFNKNIMKKDSGFSNVNSKASNAENIAGLLAKMDAAYAANDETTCDKIFEHIAYLAKNNETCRILLARAIRDRYKDTPPVWLQDDEIALLMDNITKLLSSPYAINMLDAEKTNSETLANNEYRYIDKTTNKPIEIKTDF